MNKKELTDLVLKAKDNVYFFWNFYVAGILAVMAWLGSLDKNPSWQLKLIISIAYLSFMVMNLSGLLGSFALLRASIREYLAAVEKPGHEINEIDRVFYKEHSMFRTIRLFNREIHRYKFVVFGLHILIDTIVLIALWNNNIWLSVRA